MKRLEIFRPGTHKAMNGQEIEFSEADLKASAEAYDPQVHEAPICIGHPRHDAPAYGWVKTVDYADQSYGAMPDQVDPAFAEIVTAGRYKKVSASFYTPDSPSNPAPGVYYLRHVGFLGAQPPAVKGLGPVSFAEQEEGVIEFGDWTDRENAGILRRLREWIIGKFGIEEADQAIPGYAVEIMEDEARTTNTPEAVGDFSETTQEEGTMTPEEIKAKEQEIKDREASFAEREEKLSEKEKKARMSEDAAFVEGLVGEGKVLPRDKDFVASFMAGLSDEDVVEFGEGDNKQSKPSRQAFCDYLSGMPNLVEFSEVAGRGGDNPPENDDAEDIAKRAVEFQESEAKAGRTISVTQAVAHVTG